MAEPGNAPSWNKIPDRWSRKGFQVQILASALSNHMFQKSEGYLEKQSDIEKYLAAEIDGYRTIANMTMAFTGSLIAFILAVYFGNTSGFILGVMAIIVLFILSYKAYIDNLRALDDYELVILYPNTYHLKILNTITCLGKLFGRKRAFMYELIPIGKKKRGKPNKARLFSSFQYKP